MTQDLVDITDCTHQLCPLLTADLAVVLRMTCRCQLVFPGIGDEAMVVRSAVELHLDKYCQLPDEATAPLLPAAQELGATAAVVAKLPPVSCYKVVGLAFCSYPMPEGLRQQQQPPVAESAAAAAAAEGGLDDLLGLTGDDEAMPPAAGDGKHSSIATAFDDDDDIGGLLDFDVDELINDVAALEQQPGAHRLPSLPLPPLPAELQQHAAPAAAAPAAADASQQQQQGKGPPLPSGSAAASGPPEYRPPCMWALLSPVDSSSSSNGLAGGASEPDFLLPDRFQQRQQQDTAATAQAAAAAGTPGGRPYIALPFHIDACLPDFLVQPAVYDAGAGRSWLPGDRFGMYVGARQVSAGQALAGSGASLGGSSTEGCCWGLGCSMAGTSSQ